MTQQQKVMGHKKVCLECRLTLNRPFDSGSEQTYSCPECGKSMTLLPLRFRPPKKTEDKKWETIKFLIEKGFYFQHICELVKIKNGVTNYKNYAKYLDNLRDAKEFVEQYKDQARK
jgi:transposase-like protein